MTATEQLTEETMEFANFNHIKGLIQNGISPEIIAKSFGLPIQKIENIITKIKAYYVLKSGWSGSRG